MENLFDFMRTVKITEAEIKQVITVCDLVDDSLAAMQKDLEEKKEKKKEIEHILKMVSGNPSMGMLAMGPNGKIDPKEILDGIEEAIAGFEKLYNEKREETSCLRGFKNKMMAIAETMKGE